MYLVGTPSMIAGKPSNKPNRIVYTSHLWRFPKSWGYPNSWMVFSYGKSPATRSSAPALLHLLHRKAAQRPLRPAARAPQKTGTFMTPHMLMGNHDI